MRKAENVFEVDAVLDPTDRDRMLFAQQYLTGDAATRWQQHREKHPEAVWSHMKTFPTDLTAPPQQRSDHAFQQQCNAMQVKDQSLTEFAANITNTAQGTQISDYDKHMFLCTWMHPEICAALLRGVEHPTFDALLEACLYVEADLCLRLVFERVGRNRRRTKRGQTSPKSPAMNP
jgi:hypothetical protein